MNDEDRAALLERLRRVRPDTQPAWGRLTAPRMLCHLADGMRVALGELEAQPVHNFATRTVLKFLAVHTRLEAPRGLHTTPETLTSQPASWEDDLSACLELAGRIGRGAAHAVHPTFGPLSPEEWGRVAWRHINHHLVQFRV